MPRPKHIPTPEQRAQVKALSAFGIPQPEIARYMRISETILRRRYRDELDDGRIELVAEVAACLARQAKEGSVPAAIFILKARGGWREKHDIAVTGPNGGPLQTEHRQTVDLSRLSPQALAELDALLPPDHDL